MSPALLKNLAEKSLKNSGKNFFLSVQENIITAQWEATACCPQGILSEGEGSVHLTSLY